MMMSSSLILMTFLHGTCCLLPNQSQIYYTPVSGHAPFFPLAAPVGILVTAPASFAVQLLICVDGSMSGLFFLPITFHVLGSYSPLFFLLMNKLVMHWFCHFQFPSISDMMIKSVADITLRERSQYQEEGTDSTA